MKRDMDLIRRILIAIEEHPHGQAPNDLQIDGWDEETIGYHLVLMGQDDGGLLQGVNTTTAFGAPSPSAAIERMTWKGHEFLDNVRNEGVWNKARASWRQKGGSVSFEVLRLIVVETVKSYVLPGALPPAPPHP